MTVAVGPAAVALRFLDDLVSNGGLKPGDKLPTERELAVQAGVSRAVIRSVLDDLETVECCCVTSAGALSSLRATR